MNQTTYLWAWSLLVCIITANTTQAQLQHVPASKQDYKLLEATSLEGQHAFLKECIQYLHPGVIPTNWYQNKANSSHYQTSFDKNGETIHLMDIHYKSDGQQWKVAVTESVYPIYGASSWDWVSDTEDQKALLALSSNHVPKDEVMVVEYTFTLPQNYNIKQISATSISLQQVVRYGIWKEENFQELYHKAMK